MNHIAEQTIEAYVLHPEELDSVARQSAANHLEVCAACSAIADFLRAFYNELNDFSGEVAPPVDEFVSAHFPGARLVPLYPFRSQPDNVYASGEYTVVLAALTHEPPAPRFQTVATLASAQKDTLLRILRDNAINAFRLYILSEDRRHREHAIISFPELALDFVADEKGQATFALDEQTIPANWETLKSVLRLPILEIRLSADQLRQNPLALEEIAGADHVAKIAYEKDTLAFDLQPRRHEVPTSSLAVIETRTDQKFFVTLHDGKGSLHHIQLPETLVIRFYC